MTAKTSDERQKSELPVEKVVEKGHVPLARAGKEEEMGMAVVSLFISLPPQANILTSLAIPCEKRLCEWSDSDC